MLTHAVHDRRRSTLPWGPCLTALLLLILPALLAAPAKAEPGGGHGGRGHGGYYQGGSSHRGHSSYRGHRGHGGKHYGHGGTRYGHGGNRYGHGGNRYGHGGNRYSHGSRYYGRGKYGDHGGRSRYYGSHRGRYGYGYRGSAYYGYGTRYPYPSYYYSAPHVYGGYGSRGFYVGTGDFYLGYQSAPAPAYERYIAVPPPDPLTLQGTGSVETETFEEPAPDPEVDGGTAGPWDTRPEPARAVISIEPGDASVYLDGHFLGLASELPNELLLDPGDHRLEVLRPGFVSHEVDLEAESGVTIELEAHLRPDGAGSE